MSCQQWTAGDLQAATKAVQQERYHLELQLLYMGSQGAHYMIM